MMQLISTRFARRLFLAITLLFMLCGAPDALAQIKRQFDVRIPMRDRVELSADIWMPAQEGKYPTILLRTPYLKTVEPPEVFQLGQFYAEKGYVLVVQDVRGRGDSDGDFKFFFNEAKDGYDSIEWIAKQPWSNGRVGMMGGSYLSSAQWLAAKERPPHLVCIASTAAPGSWFEHEPYAGGAFGLRFLLGWFNATSGQISQTNAAGTDLKAVYSHRPLNTMDEFLGRRMPDFKETLAQPTQNGYWKPLYLTPDDFSKINLPALHITGLFDSFQSGALYFWRGMTASSPAKDKQYLIMGPWTHPGAIYGQGPQVGDMQFPKEAVVDLKALHVAFFDHFLKGSSPRFDFPKVRIFATGANKWRDEQEYPLSIAQNQNLYFHSGGKANTLNGDGRLSWAAPENEPPDQFTYDPKNPVPSDIGDGFQGPWGDMGLGMDRRSIQKRDDVLVYTSEPLEEPLEIAGRLTLNLFASSDAKDTDFTANIVDVDPTGKAIKLGPTAAGVIRARYRKGFDKTALLEPNKPEQFKINLFDIVHTFLPGHRIRIEISSSSFPAIAPNSNTGNPIATDTEWKTARQTIYHDRSRASYVSLPVVSKRRDRM
ncbi:MAG TPA: CocE/NonD family hydrolase [Blastocatellia bacterium]|nr:CocE/NonD family hydrolase [Blastocatellia bacterium]